MGRVIQLVMPLPGPNPKQLLAFRDTHRYVAYGGARGGGKSWFVRWKAILFCCRYPGIKVLITRLSYPELTNNHIEPLKKLLRCGAEDQIASYNDSKKIMTFPNGSTLKFGYCGNERDLGQYQGAEYDVWFADEAGQMQEKWLVDINACVRGVNEFPKRTYYTLNPGGPSHGYFKRIFVDRRFEGNERPEDYSFIQALVTDNQALMESQPDYIKALEVLPEKQRKAWLNGEWDVFEGQFFEDFRPDPPRGKGDPEVLRQRRQWCHVIEPFQIPDGWTIYRSYDWGYGKPFSFGWWAVDYDGVLYRILELYGCTNEPNTGVKWTTDKQMKEAARIEREHPWLKGKNILGVADPAIWDGSKGESAAETAMKYGLYFQKGVNDRIPGWMQVHYRLAFDENGYPQMYVFKGCKAFIRTIPTLQYSETRPEDLDTDGEDHVADEVRYMCMARPIKPMLEEAAQPIYSDPLDLMVDKRRSGFGLMIGGKYV